MKVSNRWVQLSIILTAIVFNLAFPSQELKDQIELGVLVYTAIPTGRDERK